MKMYAKSCKYNLDYRKSRDLCRRKVSLRNKHSPHSSMPSRKQIFKTPRPPSNEDRLKQILDNQTGMLRRLVAVEGFIKSESIHKGEFQAQTKQAREALILSRQTLHATKQILGENFEQFSSRFPMSSLAEIKDLEEQMKVTEFNESMRNYLRKLKGTSSSPEFVFRKLITDKCAKDFNWDGRCGKKAINSLKLFDKTLFDIFETERQEFEILMRKAIDRSHNRWKQQKLQQKRKASDPLNTDDMLK